ncbi:IS66 family insertion sequence element accessory protein TnpB [Thauera sp.]|uniref:IS66 family insertion sequence element accessory protein TnpA n=1 Tax=Thauera sp. TaxID=1905334 RepID=UPI002D080C53|nr:IS66 family insertion sequence element accessory protein TnpB [Thauera sp.]HRP26743.1 IS66 family insertion sequence element accessory protein TnpB [Thauera sp.]
MTRATARNNKWQRRSRQEWQAVIGRFAQSGLGIKPFCAREGISESSLHRWRSLLGEPSTRSAAAQAMEPPGFVDAGTLRLGGGRIEIKLDLGDGVVLHLSRG